MAIDPDRKKQLLEFLGMRAPNLGPCPLCGNQKWILGDNILELREFRGGGLAIGGKLFPVVPLTCNNCGNTLFLSALFSKVVEVSKKKEDGNEPE